MKSKIGFKITTNYLPEINRIFSTYQYRELKIDDYGRLPSSPQTATIESYFDVKLLAVR
jgi:hypothetical protein